ncbi:MAG: PD40 domain-containing protein [Ekhidna sp.]|nr:PD40 domain-containing protein [Ekhidna sp.]
MNMLTFIGGLLISLAVSAQELILKPSISPDGTEILFSFQGDIWRVSSTGGRADRLTIHEAYETNPVWINAEMIAFQSDRFGNADIYTMPSKGGVPDRLTFYSSGDNLYSAKDDMLYFNTSRIYRAVEWESEIYRVSIHGGTPVRFMDALGYDPVVSPDGNRVAFVRGTCRIAREAYTGPADRDIWVWNVFDDTYEKITSFEGNDFSPQWLNDSTILYISSSSGKYNVHQMDLNGDDRQLTSEIEWGVNSFSLSRSTQKIAYQYGDQIAALDLSSNNKSVLSIDVSGDYRFDPIADKKVSNDLEDYSISPNGKLIAYSVRGEVFVTRNDEKEKRSVRLTTTSDRERDVAWLNDKTLLFISDKNGQNDLFKITSGDPNQKDLFRSLKHKITLLKQTSEEEFNPVVSPDKKKIALRRGRGELIVADISEQGILSNEKILQDGWDTPQGVSWSPDSKWIAYGLADLTFNQEIFIHAADNSREPVNISLHPKYDGSPVWSKDGRKLGFVSQRNNSDSDIWFVWLTKEDWEISNEKRKRESVYEEDKKEEKDEDEEEIEVKVQIDFDGIYKRLEQVTRFAGNESDFLFDEQGEFIYYAVGGSWRQNFEADRNLYKIKWDGSENEEVFGGNKGPYDLSQSEDGKEFYFLITGGILNKLKEDKAETLATSSPLKINYREEREQVFEEGWRSLDAGFYDPRFHGKDWGALKAKYKPLAMKASTQEDFSFVFNAMLGQLNASHMGHRGGENPKQTQKDRSGFIGVEGSNEAGGFKISGVLPGSPADRTESKLRAGDIITSVNQQPISASANFFSTLVNQRDEPVLLSVSRDGKSREVVIWPTASLRQVQYDNWVEQRRKLVNEYSDGKIGYLHIRGMNWTSFERFERELTAAGYGKEGMVIDVRWNGGGWTTDYLMAVLTVRQHAYTVPRGATDDLDANHWKFKDTYPFSERLPLAAWTKPSIALCNENSYSNAEIFSHAFKTLDIGTLVGQPTFGAVISTGSHGLMDGSFVRMPFRAWYVKATEENMEHGPAVPDLLVDHTPAYKARNLDPQLKSAVEQLLSEMN